MYTKRVTYSKEFLTGNLAGCIVRCSFPTTDDAVHLHMAALNRVRKNNPGTENGCTYWIYNLGCEDIPTFDIREYSYDAESNRTQAFVATREFSEWMTIAGYVPLSGMRSVVTPIVERRIAETAGLRGGELT